jgi:hypothetical protein
LTTVKLPDLTTRGSFVLGLFATVIDGPWLFRHRATVFEHREQQVKREEELLQ